VPRIIEEVSWLTAREAAERAGVRVETIYRWIRQENFPVNVRRLRRGQQGYIYLLHQQEFEDYITSAPPDPH
jgi:excisionase family DNA binding protein